MFSNIELDVSDVPLEIPIPTSKTWIKRKINQNNNETV